MKAQCFVCGKDQNLFLINNDSFICKTCQEIWSNNLLKETDYAVEVKSSFKFK